nr:TonB-dependent receptor [Desulfobacterales bacterium]
MDEVSRHLFKPYILLVVLFLSWSCFSLNVAAQSDEEMKILRMFYKDEELVVTPTRHSKPISQVAENVTVITAKEIEEMNAHTVAEALKRIPGFFICFNQGVESFGSTSLIQVQGSEERHVLVVVDGVPWNFLNSGHAETNSIPVGIIDRIEVIKGPASSAWGSSLGGVINIITKPEGTTKRPSGSVSASYGERATQDYRAEVSGQTHGVGYYLFAGYQDSNGLMGSRYFHNYSLYSKFRIPLSKDIDLGLTMGYSEPEIRLGDYPSGDITQTGFGRTFFATASLGGSLTRELSLNVSFRHLRQNSRVVSDALGLGVSGPPGELFLDNICDEKATGGSGKLVWEKGVHTGVFGVDFESGDLDQTLYAGSVLQSQGAPPVSVTRPRRERWALYVNDTLIIDRWSITPGIRYDHDSIAGSFLSPSLGITCRLGEHTILRSTVATGFTLPPLSWTAGGSLFIDPNPSLDPERIWSCQAGVESSASKHLWLKATLFRHELKGALKRTEHNDGSSDIFVNEGEICRQGLELEAETAPFHNLSLRGGFAYTRLSPSGEMGSKDIHEYTLALRYDNRDTFQAELFGHYIWWDADAFYYGSYNDSIWDFNLKRKVWSTEKATAELFLTGHNLFNGAQYTFGDVKNPRRWVEAGIRVKF